MTDIYGNAVGGGTTFPATSILSYASDFSGSMIPGSNEIPSIEYTDTHYEPIGGGGGSVDRITSLDTTSSRIIV